MPVLESSADQKYTLQLPTVSFRVITDDKSAGRPVGVHSEQIKGYGYNDGADFEKPEHYIRYIEPIESELATRVEYDMDEQDQEWLDAINAERKKDQSGPVSYEIFEIIMDKLEKEWFDLIKKIPQPASHLPVEDSKCSICDDGEGENSNAIVFCDGCNLAVHQDCYGVPYIPEGQWLCRKCTVSPENPVSCVFCPNEGGAFKQTSGGHWAHLLCAMWIPEVSVGNAIYMEPIEGVEYVPKNRWKLVCSLCRERTGACIQCDNRSCFTAFHVTCARQMGLLQTMKSVLSDGVLRAFCVKHLPDGPREGYDDDDGSEFGATTQRRRSTHQHPANNAVTTKSARAHAKSYRPGPPIVPRKITDQLFAYVSKISIRKRQPFIERLCRYWSLKREARRGAPLLKRLHLEPWTASNASKQQSEEEKAKKLKFLTLLRNDLEKVRMLAELVRKREKEKLRQAQTIKDVVDSFIFPHYARLRLTLEKISAMDRNELFVHPVNRAEVPDYFEVIKEPMCWLYIDEKLEKNDYSHVSQFKRDIYLVLDNAMKYNAAETTFHRTAKRIKTNCQPLLDELDAISAHAAFSLGEDGLPNGVIDQSPDVGDLEPSLLLLQSLAQPAVDDPSHDFLASVFAFQMEKPKEPTPPPPSPPKKKERKYESAAERRQKWEEREAKYHDRMTASRPTRAARAAVSAFAEEAGVQLSSDVDNSGPSEPAKLNRRRSTRLPPSSTIQEESAPNSVKDGARPHRPQVGVAGIETIPVISDRERREMEKAMDIVTEKVDEKDQFKRFNVGWVLPEGSKRRRSAQPELSTSRPAPIRKPRQSKTASEVPSAQAHPASSSIPDPPSSSTKTGSSLSPPPSVQASPVNKIHSSPSKPNRKRKASSGTAEATPRKRSRPTAGVKEERQSDRTLASETRETTPRGSLTRNRKDRAKAKDALEDEDDITPIPSSMDVTPKSIKKNKRKAVDEEQEEGEDDITPLPSANATPRVAKKHKTDDTRDDPEEEDPYPVGTLVWAKLTSFPFFPAEVIDPEDPEQGVPNQVIFGRAAAEADNQATGLRTWLVRFFDAQASYGWIPAKQLDMLGDSDEVDEGYLAGKERGKTKGFRRPRMKQAVRKAYRAALSHKAEDGEDGEDDGQEGDVEV
ncbi:hypothetical protein BCR39DRAFT_521494 [Naematelia encephala]|uniref:Uncharacterized protein n=1 Tax=Naematelia encephala TaxID=71784 RepID=A0A1Y2BEG0_9TREE|nr:hypothetical protein BCR39DRAFT_521494 [Naematelia encephala]